MSNVTTAVVKSMYNHLIASYSSEEVKDILIAKYPEMEGEIELLADPSQYGEEVERVAATDEVVAQLEAEIAEPVAEQGNDLLAAVKAKTAKIKQERVAKKAEAKKSEKGESKMDKARALYAAASDQSRKAMIELFMSEIGLSKAAASTYYYTCKK